MSDSSDRTHSRFGTDNSKLALWARNEVTDIFVGDQSQQRTTKGFKRGGGFEGTSVNATYVVKRLTAEFGPRGIGWDCVPEHEEYREGAPLIKGDKVVCNAVIHILKCKFWYVWGDKRGEFYSYGQTAFIFSNKFGVDTDEEAPKKSLTDAMVKAASHLGIGSDVHMGMWDDSKYVANRTEEAVAERRAELLSKPYAFIKADGDIFHAKDGATWRTDWQNRVKAWVTAKSPGLIAEAWRANEEAIERTREADPDMVAEVEAMVQEAIQSGKEQRQASQQKQPAGAASPPPTPPESFTLVDHGGTTHTLGKDPKNGRAPHERFMSGWSLSLDRITQADKLPGWFEKNKAELAKLRRHYPAAADEAERMCRERCQRLRIPYPGDAANQGGGAGGK